MAYNKSKILSVVNKECSIFESEFNKKDYFENGVLTKIHEEIEKKEVISITYIT